MKLRSLPAVWLALCISTGAPVAALSADGSLSLAVSVKDNYGALPGAAVRLLSKDGQSVARALTDGSGIARFSALTGGEYTIKASLIGFADAEKAGVAVGAADGKVDLVMTLARFSTSVTVTTANRREELLLNTAEPTTVIDQTQILDTGARNAKDLLSEQAGSGVQVNVGGGQAPPSTSATPTVATTAMRRSCTRTGPRIRAWWSLDGPRVTTSSRAVLSRFGERLSGIIPSAWASSIAKSSFPVLVSSAASRGRPASSSAIST